MLLSEYDYELPEELIAQFPADKRENSRMLILNRKDKTIAYDKRQTDRSFRHVL